MNRILIGWVNFLILSGTIWAQIFRDTSSTLASTTGVQLVKFKELHHHLRSGPIVIVNQNTFFVPNLHYDGGGPNAHFWVGNGSEPNEKGVLVPDENGSNGTLKEYNGQNVYITLPGNLTTDFIEYFGLWDIDYKQNFGFVTIPKNIVVPPKVTNFRTTKNNEFIIRVPKCCPITQSMDLNYKCVEQNHKFDPNIYIRVDVVEYFVYEPFINSMDCTGKGKYLDTAVGVRLFLNGTILKQNSIWNQDEYCIETCNLNNKTSPLRKTVAVICKSHSSGLSISSISVVLLTLTSVYLNIF